MKVKKTSSPFANLYNKIELNLGLKKIIEKQILQRMEKALIFFENIIFVPLYGFLDNYLSERISFHYGASYRGSDYKSHNLDPNNGNLGYGLIHFSLIRNTRPERVLCVGSMYGFIPFMCAKACKENKKGLVDFVDAGYDVESHNDTKRHNFGRGFWKKNNPKIHFAFMNAQKYINTYVMTTNDYAKKFPERKYDYIYIDGDHTYEGVKNDYNLFWGKLKKGGIMAFHDTDNKGMQGDIYYNVKRFCEEVIYSKKNYLHFPNPYSGLVIIQKK